MIKIEEALQLIQQNLIKMGAEKIKLSEGLHRVLAEDIYARDTLPPFDKSAMDGYAIKSEDTLSAPVVLQIQGIIPAGKESETPLEKGQAMKIMTGAPLPEGADAVIQIEAVRVEGSKLLIERTVAKGTNILKKGEEINCGDLALQKGKQIRPVEIGLLASLGYDEILVYKLPQVGILSTGDELIAIDQPLEKGKIRNANEYSLLALCENLKIPCQSFGIAKDNPEALKNIIKEAAKTSDIIISSGGVSVGDFDYIEGVLEALGAKVHFNSVAIKPGKPITFATIGSKVFFGMPGNPLSLITTFETFVKPCIKAMCGLAFEVESTFKMIARDYFKTKNSRCKYIYVHIQEKDGLFYALDLGTQCSNHLMTTSRANGLIIVDGETLEIKPGESVYGRFIFRP